MNECIIHEFFPKGRWDSMTNYVVDAAHTVGFVKNMTIAAKAGFTDTTTAVNGVTTIPMPMENRLKKRRLSRTRCSLPRTLARSHLVKWPELWATFLSLPDESRYIFCYNRRILMVQENFCGSTNMAFYYHLYYSWRLSYADLYHLMEYIG